MLDVGCGHVPFAYATHLADASVFDHSERMGTPIPRDGRPLYECSVDSMPFGDGEFDFVYCSQVLEHVDDPAAACRELIRVGKRGYIECPRSWIEHVFPSDDHKWLVDLEQNTLIFRRKTARETGDPLGIQLAVWDWLRNERALAYWDSERMQALRNVQFEWEGRFDIAVIRAHERGAGAAGPAGRGAVGPPFCPPGAIEALAFSVIRHWLLRKVRRVGTRLIGRRHSGDGYPALFQPGVAPGAPTRALVGRAVFPAAETARRLGREAYSYRFAYRAFAPLFRRWGATVEFTGRQTELDGALRRARRQGLEPLHVSFLPLHWTPPTSVVPTVAFPAWEYPDLPNANVADDPRANWVRTADRLALVVANSTFSRQAFVRAGVRTPVHLVPIPIEPAYFTVPDWEPGQRVVLDVPAWVFPDQSAPVSSPSPSVDGRARRLWTRAVWPRAEHLYERALKPRLSERLGKKLALAAAAFAGAREGVALEEDLPEPVRGGLALSGVVYTSVLNPIDQRKNWEDLLTAYLLALRDREDATLVLKLVVPPDLAATWLNSLLRRYLDLNVRHRCKLVFLTAYLSEAQMVELARASTYYLNSSRAEGACIPLQAFLAAGRPGVAPAHTAMADYVDEDVGFVVASHPEPAAWPHPPETGATTTWHRIVWQSLHDQIRASYELARDDPGRYAALAARGRERLAAFAGREAVWPRLAAALDAATSGSLDAPAGQDGGIRADGQQVAGRGSGAMA